MRLVPIALAFASCLPPVATATAAILPDAGGPSLVIGADGLGLVAYRDLVNRDLVVAHCVDAACSAVTRMTVDSPGDVGSRASIALRSDGRPVISYVDATSSVLKVALCTDAVCTTSINVPVDGDLQGGGDGATAVAIGTDGYPLIAYTTGPRVGFNGRLRVAHCEDATCTSITRTTLGESALFPGLSRGPVSLEIGGDGLGLIATSRSLPLVGFNTIDVWHCTNAACTETTAVASGHERLMVSSVASDPSIAIAPDGLPAYAYGIAGTSGPNGVFLVRCQDAACTTDTSQQIPDSFGGPSLAIDGSNRPRVVAHTSFTTHVALQYTECADAACTTQTQTCLAPWGGYPSLALGASGAPLVAFEVGNERVDVVPPSAGCAQPQLAAVDTAGLEDFAPMRFRVGLAPPAATPVTVSYATGDGTAQAGLDYTPVSGTLTFAPGETFQEVSVPLVADDTDETDETIRMFLSTTTGVPIVDAAAVGTIEDDDLKVFAGDCVVVEGNSGTRECSFEVRLSSAASDPIGVGYQTAGGTATSGVDFLARSGAITFVPGTTSMPVTVSVVGDIATEGDELFRFLLTDPSNAEPGDLEGAGVILDDDGPALASQPLVHGSSIVADFAPKAGPAADQDDYRISQPPYSSHEVVLDAVSGDAAPGAHLARIANDGVTVLQTSTPVGTGSAVALRFLNDLPATVENQYVRVVGAACGAGCDADDTYRVRAYETTGFIPRFNNGGSQLTVLILQNTTDRPVAAAAHFWSPSGDRLDSRAILLAPHATDVLQTASRPNLEGRTGTITVAHTAGYGALAGKAVALEPATGFSFDSPMMSKPR